MSAFYALARNRAECQAPCTISAVVIIQAPREHGSVRPKNRRIMYSAINAGAAAGEKAVTGDSKMACTACETMQGGPAGAGPHAGQSLVYRRKEGLAVRLFYVCRLCDTQMLCRLGSAEHDAGWSMTMSGGGPGPVGQMDAV